ncbi:MAG TPA: capsid protein, partial [Ruminococcus sp.]|nr:capsid protein [Ruminococcus sp.]
MSERRYKLEQKQRALERAVRRAKRKVNGVTDPDNIKKAKAELRQAQKNLKDFIDKVN